jgi:hypothetical protein
VALVLVGSSCETEGSSGGLGEVEMSVMMIPLQTLYFYKKDMVIYKENNTYKLQSRTGEKP